MNFQKDFGHSGWVSVDQHRVWKAAVDDGYFLKLWNLHFKLVDWCNAVTMLFIILHFSLNGADNFVLMRCDQAFFSVAAPRLWKKLPADLRTITDPSLLQSNLKTDLFRLALFLAVLHPLCDFTVCVITFYSWFCCKALWPPLGCWK